MTAWVDHGLNGKACWENKPSSLIRCVAAGRTPHPLIISVTFCNLMNQDNARESHGPWPQVQSGNPKCSYEGVLAACLGITGHIPSNQLLRCLPRRVQDTGSNGFSLTLAMRPDCGELVSGFQIPRMSLACSACYCFCCRSCYPGALRM